MMLTTNTLRGLLRCDFQGSGPRALLRAFFIVTLCSLVLNTVCSNPSWAQESQRHPVEHAALGVSSFLATIPYGAAKLLYAGLGSMVGGFSYILTLGNSETAHTIWEKSMLGTYVLSPEQLTGEKRIRFVGP